MEESTGSFAVLTMTPDAVAQRLAPAILQALQTRNIEVVFALPRLFSPAEAVMLYDGKVTHNTGESRLHSSWISPNLWSNGQSLFLVLRSRSKGLVHQINAVKGRSRFGVPRTGELRALSGLTDRGFSLVHSPDSDADVLHELHVVLGRKTAAALMTAKQSGIRHRDVLQLLPPPSLESPDRRPFDVLPWAYGQVAAHVLCTSVNETMRRPAEHLLSYVVDDWAATMRSEPLAGMPWELLERWEQPAKILFDMCRQSLSATDDPHEIGRLLAQLKALSVLRSWRRDLITARESGALAGALEMCGFFVERWDRHLMDLAAAYHA